MADWVVSAMEDGGNVMVGAMMFLENVFPPIPSELVMPLAGYTAHQSDLNIWDHWARWPVRCSGITPDCSSAASA